MRGILIPLRVIVDAAATMQRPVRIEHALLTTEPSLAGAREAAVEALRNDLLARAIGSGAPGVGEGV